MNDGRVPELIPAVTRLTETNVRADDRVALLAPTSTDSAVVTALWSALTAVGADVTTLTIVPSDVQNDPLRPVLAGAIDRADVVVNCGAYAGFPPEILEFVRNGGRHLKLYATIDALTDGTAAAHLDPRTAGRMRRDVERCADRLARTLDEHGEGFRSVGEFGFGMNPRTRPTGVATNDKKLRGTAHVGLGDVTAWPTLTGTPTVDAGRPAPLHLDGICRSATLRLDGETVIDDGSIVSDS